MSMYWEISFLQDQKKILLWLRPSMHPQIRLNIFALSSDFFFFFYQPLAQGFEIYECNVVEILWRRELGLRVGVRGNTWWPLRSVPFKTFGINMQIYLCSDLNLPAAANCGAIICLSFLNANNKVRIGRGKIGLQREMTRSLETMWDDKHWHS